MEDREFTDRIKDHNKKGAWGWFIFQMTQGHCAYCGKVLDFEGLWHLDHIIPRSKGGCWKDNLIAACPRCNLSKGGRGNERWRKCIPNRLCTGIKRILPQFEQWLPFLPEEDAKFIEHRLADILDRLQETQAEFYIDRMED